MFTQKKHIFLLLFIIFFIISPISAQQDNNPIKGQVFPKEALFYEKLPGTDKNVHCLLCPRSCVISPNNVGICTVRQNKNGVLYTLAYSNPCAVHVDPIEKKPFFHYLPGTLSFSIATAGCNVRCIHCQNWEIAQMNPKETFNYKFSPSDIAVLAKKNRLCNYSLYLYRTNRVF